MRSRVIPGSSPTIDRRLAVSRLNSVLLPTLGRPTIATSGSFAAPAFAGTTDLRYVGKGTPIDGTDSARLCSFLVSRHDHRRLTPYASKTVSLLSRLQPSSSVWAA